LVKFVSEPASPPQLVEFPEEGKAKAKERREVGEETTQLLSRTRPRRTAMRRRSKSASSCNQGLAALDCRTFRSFRIRLLA
jgi:hypothetical protein